jgi:archaemetzincin
MRRRLLPVLVIVVGAIVYGAVRWWAASQDDGSADVPIPIALPEDAQLLLTAAELIRPLHEKKRPVQPGDWLDRFPEGGQDFAHYVQFRGAKPLCDEFSTIYIQPLGEFDETQQRIVGKTAEFMALYSGVPVKTLEPLEFGEIPAESQRIRDDGRRQLLTTWIIYDVLKPRRPNDAIAVIGLVTDDLWVGNFNWLFGEASIPERVGVWSLHRNGDPRASDDAFTLCLRRTLKTAVHETGHMLGIPHCVSWECAMNGSRSREENDSQPLEFCPECQPKIWWTCGADPLGRSLALKKFATDNNLKTAAAFWSRQTDALKPLHSGRDR